MDYVKCVVATAMVAQKVPSLAVDEWLEVRALDETEELQAARRVCSSIFLPRVQRADVLALLAGNTGVGKTFATVAALGEALVAAHQRRESGALQVDRPERAPGAGQLSPQEKGRLVHDLFAMDLESYETQERLFPGVLSGSLQRALEDGTGWDWAAAPLSFVWWNASEVANGDVFSDAFRQAKEEAKWADITVLDDLGAEAVGPRSPWPAIINEIVSVRHAEGLPLLLTTNARVVDFRERFGARVVDRIRERGVCLQNNSPSRRARRAGGGA